MTKNLDDRILELKKEQLMLTESHDQAVMQLQQIIQNNRNRYQQILGAIAVLNEMKNGENP